MVPAKSKDWQSYVDDLQDQFRRLSELCDKNNNCDMALFSEMSQRLDELLRAGRTKEIANMIKENILGVMIIGLGPVLQYSNARAREILGSDALIKTELDSDGEVFFLADQVTLCRNHLPWLRALHGQNVDGDLIFMQPKISSGDKWLRVCALPQRSRTDDAIVATIVLLIDVTEQTQNEHQLRQIRQALKESKMAMAIAAGSNAEVEPEGRKLALIADDLQVDQILLTSQLESMNFAVHHASNGREAVEAASRANYKLILMDCDMPIMDGYAATKAIRAAEKGNEERSQALIISLTAHNRECDREKCLAAGADEYLPKSADPTLLTTLVQELLREVPVAVSASRPSVGPKFSVGTSDSASPVPDLKALEERYGEVRLKEVLDVFVSSSQTLLDYIQDSLTQRDARGTHHFACCLKGTAALLAAGKMSKLCGEIAESAIRGKWFDADDYYAELDNAFRALRKTFPAGTGSSGLYAREQSISTTRTLSLEVLESKVGRRQATIIAQNFRAQSKTLFESMTLAIKKYDYEELYRQAQNLSAACATFLLAKDLRALSKELEVACDEQHVDWIEVAELFERMTKSNNAIEQQILRYLEVSKSV